MSNYSVPTKDDDERDLDIYVGWDPMLSSYFAHVVDNSKEEDEKGHDVLWIGCTTNEIHDLGIIVDTLDSHRVEIPEEILAKIYRDANE